LSGSADRADLASRSQPLLPTARLPGKKQIAGDHRDHDKHPVLTLETQKCERFNEKSHDARLIFGRSIYPSQAKIYYLYIAEA
jgi:hypothetical protein